ncbi:hypothetical protein SAMN05660473_04158 [Arthrobacter sp. 49Tsu3.1M3]|uniref:hypothetical protein n=1 Tax=Arthrobacter sp. 49Tsu3.1M3 TaxID=1279029 RepID=UPI0009A7E467|nr:hypothetical protein [Arthrobacter sp. 49Tsu3.1M3]SKC10015.1 hypothetical protein SAMN05660473_04158 [Arthrobacter sp. 49Tsu3.1M3]
MDDVRRTARILLRRKSLAVIDLWISYWNHGGYCSPFDLDACIHELLPVECFDEGALACALDDLSLETAG